MYGMKSRYVVIKYDIGNGVTQEKTCQRDDVQKQ